MIARGKKALIADISRTNAALTAGMLAVEGYDCDIVCDGGEALRLAAFEAYDVVVADAVLPVLDGAALAARLRDAGLVRIPGVVIAAYKGMARPLINMGVDVIFKPIEHTALMEAVAAVDIDARKPSSSFSERLANIMDELGVPEHPGREYIADAVFLAGEDRRLIGALTTELYPMVARRCGTNPETIERGMRHVIEKAWSQGSIEKQYGIFKETIDAAKGKPTCGGMIAQLTELVRMEVF